MKKLTHRQQEVFDFISSYIHNHKFPPTIREVADQFGISVKGSYDHIKALERKEFIHCDLNKSRTITVVVEDDDSHPEVKKIPLLGEVAAGKPLFAEENFDGDIELPSDYVKTGSQVFAVKVKGDSMKDAGILSGDIAVINHQETANNGEIVVAMVEDAVTLKKVYMEKNRIKLESENAAYPPIYTQSARILGKLTYIVRSYS